jgi:predicted regulator of Ras-like GTPase activity (Roadblock/LC7/MglB family)
MMETLEKLKAKGIMAAIIRKDGQVQASNFNLPDGVETMASYGFNISDALLREVNDEATELIITAGPKNIILKAIKGDNILFTVITSKEQYEFYKSIVEAPQA